MNGYVLDACALIALLQEEPGADKVAAVLNAANNGEAEIVMHKANFLEVYQNLICGFFCASPSHSFRLRTANHRPSRI